MRVQEAVYVCRAGTEDVPVGPEQWYFAHQFPDFGTGWKISPGNEPGVLLALRPIDLCFLSPVQDGFLHLP